MRKTLKGSLQELHNLEERLGKAEPEIVNFGLDMTVSLSPEQVETAKKNIFREFYESNPLAHKVARGEYTYAEAIDFIADKYYSFWSKIWAPKRDDEFDQRVEKVVGSMSCVGEVPHYSDHNFDYTRLTTYKRKYFVGLMDKLWFALGASVGALFYIVTRDIEVKNSIDVALKMAPAGFLIMTYACARGISFGDAENGLKELQECAKKTDEFLRQNYSENAQPVAR